MIDIVGAQVPCAAFTHIPKSGNFERGRTQTRWVQTPKRECQNVKNKAAKYNRKIFVVVVVDDFIVLSLSKGLF